MGEEFSIKIWTLGPQVELALNKPHIDPVLTTIIAILLPSQNVKLSPQPAYSNPPPPPNTALNQPRLFLNKHINKCFKWTQMFRFAVAKYKQDLLNISCLKSLT